MNPYRIEGPALLNGPAAEMMRDHIADQSVDMVYSDPPFGNRQHWTGRVGSFSDKWKWDAAAERGWSALAAHSPAGAELIAAVTPGNSDRAYLANIAAILIEARRVLRPTGTLWLHFDDTMGAHLRVLGDVIFSANNQLGTVVWHRTAAHSHAGRQFGRVHDTIACWARTRAARARLSRIGEHELVHGDWLGGGIFVGGLLSDRLNATSTERVGYPTQKPVAMLERLICAATLPGDTVLDPTCGSGTTLVAAQRLGRRAVGIDLSPDAIEASSKRLYQPQGDLFGSLAA